MTAVLLDATKPEGKNTLTVHCGTPTNESVNNFQGITMTRVWDDGTLAAFDATGRTIAFFRPGSYWSFLWQ